MVKNKRRSRRDNLPASGPELEPPDVFQKLPCELYAKIFRECLAETYPNTTWRRMEVRLSHVSKRWRDIALSESSLWTVITTPPDHKPTVDKVLERVRIYIKRSGKRPLDLFIHFDGKKGVPLFESIFAQIDRWRHIHFTATTDSFWFTKFKDRLAAAKVPILEHAAILGVLNPHLQVVRREHTGNVPTAGLIAQIFQQGAPFLQSFIVNSDGFRSLLPPLHWRIRLLHIRETAVPQLAHRAPILLWEELKEIFSLPNLEDLMITGCAFHFHYDSDDSDSDDSGSDAGPIVAPRLRSFCFDWAPFSWGVEHLQHIFAHLVADNLERLGVICAMVADDRNRLQFAKDPPKNHLPSVTTLEIRDCYFGYDSYLYFMKLCPNLQVLNIWLEFAGDQELLKILEARVFEERNADDPGQQNPDWDLEIDAEEYDSGWWRDRDSLIDVEESGSARGRGGTGNAEESDSARGRVGRSDEETSNSTSGRSGTNGHEESDSTSGHDGTSDTESESASDADSDDSNAMCLARQIHQNLQFFQVRYDLFRELKRAERKFGKSPGWPSLSVLGYTSLSTFPNFGRTRHWLQYRQKKKAAKLSALKVPTRWLSDRDQTFQTERAQIETFVNSVAGMEDDWRQCRVSGKGVLDN